MLSNLGWASTCNAVGRSAGIVLVTILLVSLTSPTLPRTVKDYFGISIGLQTLPSPVNGTVTVLSRKQFMYISYKYFFISCGVFFLIANTLLVFIRERPGESSLSKEKTPSNLGDTHSQPLFNQQADTSNPSRGDTATPESQIVGLNPTISCASHSRVVNLNGAESPCTTAEPGISGNEEEIPLTVKGTYKIMFDILKLRPIWTYIALLFVINVRPRPLLDFLLSASSSMLVHTFEVSVKLGCIVDLFNQQHTPICQATPDLLF